MQGITTLERVECQSLYATDAKTTRSDAHLHACSTFPTSEVIVGNQKLNITNKNANKEEPTAARPAATDGASKQRG